MMRLTDMKKIVLTIMGVLLFAGLVSADWLATHSYRMKVAIDSTNVGSLLEDFPLYVTFFDTTIADSIGAHARSDGFDIKFTKTDGITDLPYDRERFTIVAGRAVGYHFVNVDSIHATDSTWIYIYFGDADSGDLENESGAWNSGFKLVMHLEEGYSTDADFYKDETSNNNDGQLIDANTNSAFVVAKIDSAINFNGDADQINAGNGSSVRITGALTLSAWVNSDANQNEEVLGRYGSVADSTAYGIETDAGTSDTKYLFKVQDDGCSGGAFESGETAELADGSWHHLVGVYIPSGSVGIYANGSLVAENTSSIPSAACDPTTDFTIGATDFDYFNGSIDEVRISNVARSADWIKFEHENINQADKELVWHAQEEAPAASKFIMVN